MKKFTSSLPLLCLIFLYGISPAQNVGIGTNSPAEKLHVAGSLRVDDLQSATNAAAATDKIVWVDANGKVYSFPAGLPGRVLGMSGTGVLAWLNPGVANSLNDGQIWIGDNANLPVAQTPSGDATISNIGVITIQDDAVDGTDISITGESNGSLMYFNGTDWIALGLGAPNQVLTVSGGVPTWANLPAAPTTGDLTTTTPGVSVTNGTGAVLGSGTSVEVATNALNQNGLVPGPTAANGLQVWGTDIAGNPGWIDPSSLVDVDNGLYYNGVAGKIRQGGALVEHTTIDQGNFNYLHQLSGTGVFEARNAATSGNGLLVTPTDRVGAGTPMPNAKVEIKGEGSSNATAGFHVKNSNDKTMFYVRDDGRVGIGTTQPTQHFGSARLTIESQNGAESDFVIRTADSIPFATIPWIVLQNSRGTLSNPTLLPNGSSAGSIYGQGYDGAAFQSNAYMDLGIDGATGLNDMPGRLSFGTTPDGTNTPVERMRINNAGNVGVNNTNPLNKVDILGGGGRTGTHPTGRALYVTGTYGPNNNGVEFRHDNGTQGIGFGYNTIYATGTNASQDLGFQALGTGGNLLFTTNALERMRVAANGTVGINTTAPNAVAKLHINSGGILLSSNGVGTPTNLPPDQTDNSDLHLFLRTTRPAPNATASDLRLYIEDDGNDAFSIYGNSCGGGGCFNLANSKQVVTFQANGRIGVNTTNPLGRLDVGGPFYNIANAYKDWSELTTGCSWGGAGVYVQCFTPTQNGVVTRMDLYLWAAPAGTYTLTVNGQSATLVNPTPNAVNTFNFPTPPAVTGGVSINWTMTGPVASSVVGNCGGGCGNGSGGATYWNEIWIAPTGILNSNLFVSDINGLVGVNTQTPSANLDVVGMLRVTGTFVNASDARLKKNISPIVNPLQIVQQLRGVEYYWDKDKFPEKQFSDKAQIGFIAQEVEQVLPQVVSTAADGYKGVEYGNMTAVLVEAVKELQKQVEAQNQEIKQLRALVYSADNKSPLPATPPASPAAMPQTVNAAPPTPSTVVPVYPIHPTENGLNTPIPLSPKIMGKIKPE